MKKNIFSEEVRRAGEANAVARKRTLDCIKTIHTLGPQGTNLGAASEYWFERRGCHGDVILHNTVENAIEVMPVDPSHALMTCAVYPYLHNVVFGNLDRLQFVDTLLWVTDGMVLATRNAEPITTVATHPAPQCLVPDGFKKVITTSNAMAAHQCALGEVDGCITTRAAALDNGLRIIEDHGPIPMAYTLHGYVSYEQ
jgi:hypothetical protein